VFCRKPKASKVSKQRPRQENMAKAFRTMKMEVTSQRRHTSRHQKVAASTPACGDASLEFCKAVSKCNRLDYLPDHIVYWLGRWLGAFEAL
jgi:hypothetical protein